MRINRSRITKMKLKKKSATRELMLKLIKKGNGRLGTKDIGEIKKLVMGDKLLDAYFSIVIKLQYKLQANFHHKFHVNFEKIRDNQPQERDIKKLWETFSEKIDRFSTIIFISYSTDLIKKDTYDKLNELRDLRNQIAHNLTYYEPEIFVTENEVKDAVEKGIKLLEELEEIQKDIVFCRK